MTRWAGIVGDDGGRRYAARFADLAASGVDVHGEADFCERLLGAGAGAGAVLDAGCGTGRVSIELSRRGFACVGVDLDDSMLAVARQASRGVAPGVVWIRQDLTTLDLSGRFDLVLAAGNVLPLLAQGAEAEAVRRLADHLATGGLLVAGFGLDPAHLPLDEAPFGLAAYDAWCAAAGLERRGRFSSWDGQPFTEGGYAVSVHGLARLAPTDPAPGQAAAEHPPERPC